MSVRPGQIVDRYRVERVLSARDEVDTVADATSPAGERVTLKLLAQPLEGKAFRRHVAQLAQLRASIANPHMLRLLDGAESRERLCLSELPADAVTLADRLHEGPLEPELTVTLLSQVAGALEAAHARGLPHRELAPANIVVTVDEPPRALLTDFGIAVAEGRGCERPASIADADYRSPEEIRGDPPTAESNVYSLACILVHCLTGEPPFPYDRPLLALHAHLVEEPPRPSVLDPSLPEPLDRAVAKAMSKDPRGRYHSPATLMRTVQRSLGVDAPIPVQGAREEDGPAEQPQAPAGRRGSDAPRPAKPARAARKAARPAPEKRTAPESQHPTPPARRPAPEAQPARVKERTSPGGRPRSRRSRARRLAPTWAAVALLASALAGFATGNGAADDNGGKAAVAPEPATQPAETTKPTVAPVVARLDERRTQARRRLRAARRPATQTVLARRLASLYGDARASLRKAPGHVSQETPLATRLLTVQRAYLQLSRAARAHDRGAWRRASDEVVDRERDLELLLRTQRWT